jgi:RHS repeat-associated protein
MFGQRVGPSSADGKQNPAAIYYVHNDDLGTPQAMTDAAGEVVWRATYDPFGAATVDQDVDGDGQRVTMNLRFPGQYYDQESGLHYNYFRTYDPQTGRYLTSDPISLKGGLNTYAYVSGNPLNAMDPFGLAQVWDGLGDVSICDYYDKLAAENPKCNYFSKAADICRGGSEQVNRLTIIGLMHAWNTGRSNRSQSATFNLIRRSLVFYDQQSRQAGWIDENGCTCGDTIEFYHKVAFNDAGISAKFFGGNYWPQNSDSFPWRPYDPDSFGGNPIPYDPRGDDPVDDRFDWRHRNPVMLPID